MKAKSNDNKEMKFKDENSRTQYIDGLAALNEKDFGKAIGLFQAAFPNKEEGVQIYLDIANAYKGNFDFPSASTYLKMGLTQEPTNFELNMALIQCKENMALLPEAKKHCESIKYLIKDSVPLLLAEANIAKKMGNLEEMLKIYDQIITLEPNNVMVHNLKGVHLLSSMAYDKAAESFAEILKINDKDVGALNNLAVTKFMQIKQNPDANAKTDTVLKDTVLKNSAEIFNLDTKNEVSAHNFGAWSNFFDNKEMGEIFCANSTNLCMINHQSFHVGILGQNNVLVADNGVEYSSLYI